MGCGRGGGAVCDVVVSPVAVSRRRPGGMDRIDGGRAEHLHLALQLASVRFSRRMDVCAGRGNSGRNDAGDGLRRSISIGRFRPAMIAGMVAPDELSAAPGRGRTIDIFRYWP